MKDKVTTLLHKAMKRISDKADIVFLTLEDLILIHTYLMDYMQDEDCLQIAKEIGLCREIALRVVPMTSTVTGFIVFHEGKRISI